MNFQPTLRHAARVGAFALGALLSSVVPVTATSVMVQGLPMDDSDPMSLSASAQPFVTSPSMVADFTLATTVPEVAPDAPLSLTAYPRAGWQANLSTNAHGVRGTVVIVDADTFRVDNFFYDGGGINVHFILAAANDNTTFRNNRLVTDLNLLGTAYSGGSITIDLPTGTTFDGYNAVSLWCIPANANFGSGTFANPVPEPGSACLLAFGVGSLGLFARLRRRVD